MSSLSIFARLVKVDEAKRQITGVIADETVDFSGEVFDYEKSKPNFISWSDTVQKASGGKSVGNLRAQHGSVVAGRLTELNMDDVSRSISVVADVVDDNEWSKVLKGCYTGFSIGGSYGAKWDDPTLGKKRYEAKPSEVSIVDLGCNPNASFMICKADGSQEMRKYFAADTLATDAVVAGVEAGSVGALTASLRKQLAELPEGTNDELRKYITTLLESADAAPKQKMIPGDALLKLYGEAIVAKATDPELSKLLQIGALVREGEEAALEKSMYTVSRACELLSSLGYMVCDLQCEAKFEGDKSTIPSQFKSVVSQLGPAIIALVQEEVAELVSKYGDTTMATAAPVGDLKKEAGGDAASNPAAIAPGSDPANETLLKSIGSLIDERMTKALADVSVNNEKISKGIGELRERLDKQDEQLKKLSDTPAAGGPRLRVVDKAEEMRKDLPGAAAGEVEPVKGQDGKTDDATTLIKAAHAGGGKPLQR